VLGEDPAETLRNDQPSLLLYRAATAPAALATTGWAKELAATAVEDLFTAMAGISAAAALVPRAVRVNFGRYGSISVPGRVVLAADAGSFVLDADPIPVRTLPLSALTLTPFKFGTIVTVSDELAEYSHADRVLAQLLTEAAALRFDAEAFSTTAGSTSRPGGILNGVSAISAATAGSEAMATDIGALIGALGTAGAGANPIVVAAPRQAAVLKLKAGAQFNIPVLASTALADKTVIAVEAGSFAFGFDPVPVFETSNTSAVHMEDTTPLPLNAGGVTASPIRSLFQTRTTAIKMILRCAWGMRAIGHVQVITSTNW
jgi:hypothetical protein